MTMSVVDDVLALLAKGYLPYMGHVEGSAYTSLGCGAKRKPRWFTRDRRFVCVGCPKRCSVVDPVGFELVLPVTFRTKKLIYAQLPAISAQELVTKKALLTIPEVEFILSICRTRVWDMIEEGRLTKHPDSPPARVTAESVRRELARAGVLFS
jgi:predicted DNA-binding transcriptional regulator AlpA